MAWLPMGFDISFVFGGAFFGNFQGFNGGVEDRSCRAVPLPSFLFSCRASVPDYFPRGGDFDLYPVSWPFSNLSYLPVSAHYLDHWAQLGPKSCSTVKIFLIWKLEAIHHTPCHGWNDLGMS